MIGLDPAALVVVDAEAGSWQRIADEAPETPGRGPRGSLIAGRVAPSGGKNRGNQ